MTVAILDSGVHSSHPHLAGAAIAATEAIDDSFADVVDRLGHGTAVAAAIHDIAPDATLVVGKIFDRALTTNAAMLAKGIEWAAQRGARLINLSLGTANRAHESMLREAIATAAAAGAIVVSAREANGVVWLPGSLPGVVSVTSDAALEREELIVDATGIVAAPYPRAIPGVPKERNLSGVSFAVANVSGILARVLESQPTSRRIEDLYEVLKNVNSGRV